MKNAIEDGSVVPGAGAFEVAANAALTSSDFINSIHGRAKFGVKVQKLCGLLSCVPVVVPTVFSTVLAHVLLHCVIYMYMHVT